MPCPSFTPPQEQNRAPLIFLWPKLGHNGPSWMEGKLECISSNVDSNKLLKPRIPSLKENFMLGQKEDSDTVFKYIFPMKCIKVVAPQS